MAKHVYMYNSKNGDRKYNAMSISAMLAPFFTTGVFNGSFEVRANNTMALTVKEGHAYFSGGPVVEYDEPESVTVPPPGSLPRIDRIVIRRDDPERDGYLHYLQGAYSSNPTAPGITRENGIDDRVICQFRVDPGTVAITKAMVEDKRMDPNLCGYVAATVAEINFNGIWEQWVALLQNLQDAIDGVIDGSQYMLQAGFNPDGTPARQVAFKEYPDDLQTEDKSVPGAINEVDSRVDSLVSYSFEETLTGEIWVDGKPIYQKVISFGALPNATNKSVSAGTINLDTLISYHGAAYDINGGAIPLPFSSYSSTNNNAQLILDRVSPGVFNVRVVCLSNMTIYTKTFITLKYTKTTD